MTVSSFLSLFLYMYNKGVGRLLSFVLKGFTWQPCWVDRERSPPFCRRDQRAECLHPRQRQVWVLGSSF